MKSKNKEIKLYVSNETFPPVLSFHLVKYTKLNKMKTKIRGYSELFWIKVPLSAHHRFTSI